MVPKETITLIDTISHVSEHDESEIVVVGPPAGVDGSDVEEMSDDESEGQIPEEAVFLMRLYIEN